MPILYQEMGVKPTFISKKAYSIISLHWYLSILVCFLQYRAQPRNDFYSRKRNFSHEEPDH